MICYFKIVMLYNLEVQLNYSINLISIILIIITIILGAIKVLYSNTILF